jgi:hypothetical protein
MDIEQQLKHIGGIETELFRLIEKRAASKQVDEFTDKRINQLQAQYVAFQLKY